MEHNLLLDPTTEEEWPPCQSGDKNHSNLLVGYMPSLEQICCFSHEGLSDAEPLVEATKMLIEYCNKVLPLARNCLKEAVQNNFSEKELSNCDHYEPKQ